MKRAETASAGASATEKLKPRWRLVRFDTVIRQIKVDVDPLAFGLERYVAGEHMDTDDLEIHRWGVVGDGYLGPAFHRRFRTGQVLYGSRRTYLRKVAVPNFDGICANTTFVLEPVPECLDRRLLPFILQTEPFIEHSIRESKGSVNPYINFKDIGWYEFALPPLEAQRRIAGVLWAVEEQCRSLRRAVQANNALQSSTVSEILASGADANRRWPIRECSELFIEGPTNGLSPQVNASGRGYPTLSIGAVRDGAVIPEGNIKYAVITETELERFRLRTGDILVVRGNGNRSLVAKCGVVDVAPPNCFYPDLLIRLSFDPALLRPRFVALQWNSTAIHNALLRRAKSTNGIYKINGSDLRKHKLVVPPLDVQDSIIDKADTIRIMVRTMEEHLSAVLMLKRLLLRDLLHPGEEVHAQRSNKHGTAKPTSR